MVTVVLLVKVPTNWMFVGGAPGTKVKTRKTRSHQRMPTSHVSCIYVAVCVLPWLPVSGVLTRKVER